MITVCRYVRAGIYVSQLTWLLLAKIRTFLVSLLCDMTVYTILLFPSSGSPEQAMHKWKSLLLNQLCMSFRVVRIIISVSFKTLLDSHFICTVILIPHLPYLLWAKVTTFCMSVDRMQSYHGSKLG